MIKAELRKIYLARQKAFTSEERKEKSLQIADGFFKNFNLETTRFLHVFLSIEKNREIETSFIYKRLWREFSEITTIISRVDFQTMTLDNLRFTAETNLVKNKWHIFEPTESELIEIERIDAVLVPLLCLDKRGFRVGYGKGFYDKFLSECRPDCLKIGLSYFAPIDEIADTNEFDVKLDYCIAPELIIEFNS